MDLELTVIVAEPSPPCLQLNHHHRAFTLPSPLRVHLHAPKPRRLLLFNGGVFLLHQNGIHNVVVVAAARGDEGDESGLDGAEAGIKGDKFQVRAFVNIVVAVEVGAGGGGGVGCIGFVGGFESRILELVVVEVVVVEGGGVVDGVV